MDWRVVMLHGGLGNQMFQYAFYLFLENNGLPSKYCTSLFEIQNAHNGFELYRVFGIKKNNSPIYLFLLKTLSFFYHRKRFHLISSLLSRVGLNYITEINGKIPPYYNGIYYGYWQSSIIVDNVVTEIHRRFRFRIINLTSACKEFEKKILNSKCSVSIHIRRGDFLDETNVSIYGNICTLSYYKKAISEINSRFKDITYYIFTNDYKWVTKNFNLENSEIVTCNTGRDSWQDMYLMSKCSHNIIANSTFSWWGAYLNNNPNKIVIAPSKFTNIDNPKDIYPNGWIKIK